jgi:hypothetical protein
MRKSAVRGVARFAIAAWIATLGACMADAPAPDPVAEPTASTSAASTAVAPTASSELAPDVTTVFECTTTGRWWGTRAICQANCAGGTCFACGLSCQN